MDTWIGDLLTGKQLFVDKHQKEIILAILACRESLDKGLEVLNSNLKSRKQVVAKYGSEPGRRVIARFR